MKMILLILALFAIDALLVALLLLALMPLKIFKGAAWAVLKRNFIGYFSNPTGYVFLCVFVILTTSVAFLPPAFFASNLANLDQLNYWLPLIMLVYIPSITMSIWAEERRQGTDELLLTLPADDFDIVVGKYLAAAAIYTAALLFSQVSNFAVLLSLSLGELDLGLLFSTYFGYWLMGLAMLSLGMVASFLTKNLTVGFILGALMNVPLVAASYAHTVIPSYTWSEAVKRMGMVAYLDNFGRGVISFGGIVYFALVVIVGIYLSMVLVGRRHWYGGRDGESLLGHFIIRVVALLLIALSVNLVLASYDPIRVDTTRSQVSSLSSASRKLVRDLKSKRPIRVEAYISSDTPENYMKVRRDLITMLKEFDTVGGANLNVQIYDNIDPYGKEAQQADEKYRIKVQRVSDNSGGRIREEQIIMGAAFVCGNERVIVPFFDRGTPIEYELARSIATVARGERYTLGVVTTEAPLMGGAPAFSMMGMQPPSPKAAIISELEQQYKVEAVDPSAVIPTEKYDALLIVQPSTLAPNQLPNVIAAIEAGVPAAILEDPQPVFMRVTATGSPKPPAGGMMGMGQPPPEKCDIRKLWEALGIQVLGRSGDQSPGQMGPPLFQPDVVWQTYNPYEAQLDVSFLGPEFVFVCRQMPDGSGAWVDGLNESDTATRGLDEILFPFPGAMRHISGTGLKFEKLCTTSSGISGSYSAQKVTEARGDTNKLVTARAGSSVGERIIAARITGKRKDADLKMADEEPKKTDKKDDAKKDETTKKRDGVNVVYINDIDCLADAFLGIRARPEEQLNFRFDNVTYVLNVLDSLVGDERFNDIRRRKLRYSTLALVEGEVQRLKQDEKKRREEFNDTFVKAEEELNKTKNEQVEKVNKSLKELRDKYERGEASLDEVQRLDLLMKTATIKIDKETTQKVKQLQTQRDQEIDQTRRKFNQATKAIQARYKRLAVILPPIPPILVAIAVFLVRVVREREGISRTRLRN